MNLTWETEGWVSVPALLSLLCDPGELTSPLWAPAFIS